MAQTDTRRLTLHTFLKRRLHTQQTEDVAHTRVALFRTVHQSFQHHLVVRVLAQRHHLIPVRRRTPVVLNRVSTLLVRLVLHLDGVKVAPLGIGTELTHHPQRQVDIRSRDDVTRQP